MGLDFGSPSAALAAPDSRALEARAGAAFVAWPWKNLALEGRDFFGAFRMGLSLSLQTLFLLKIHHYSFIPLKGQTIFL